MMNRIKRERDTSRSWQAALINYILLQNEQEDLVSKIEKLERKLKKGEDIKNQEQAALIEKLKLCNQQKTINLEAMSQMDQEKLTLAKKEFDRFKENMKK